jgi:hypothetical protein
MKTTLGRVGFSFLILKILTEIFSHNNSKLLIWDAKYFIT